MSQAAVTTSLALFVPLTTTSLSLTLGNFFVSNDDSERTSPAPHIYQICLMITAVLSMLYLIAIGKSSIKESHESVMLLTMQQRFLHIHVKLIGVVLFALPGLFLDVAAAVVEGLCINVWSKCYQHDWSVVTSHHVELGYRCVRVLFICVSVRFCFKFNNRRFHRTLSTQMGMMLFASAAMSFWVDATFEEISDSQNKTGQRGTSVLCPSHPAYTQTSDRDWTMKCLLKESVGDRLMVDVSPFMYPFVIEFLMLVLESNVDWFFGSCVQGELPPSNNSTERRESHSEPAPEERKREFDQSQSSSNSLSTDNNAGDEQTDVTDGRRPSAGRVTSSSTERTADQHWSPPVPDDVTAINGDDDQTVDENTHLLKVHGSGSSSQPRQRYLRPQHETADFDVITISQVLHAEQTHADEPGTFARVCIFFFHFPWLISPYAFVVISNLTFIVLGILAIMVDSPTDNTVLFIIYRTAYWSVLTANVVMAVFVTRSFAIVSSPSPHGFEYFVILCSVGPMVRCMFKILANVNLADDNTVAPSVLFLAEEATNALQIVVQMMFYPWAKMVMIGLSAYDSRNAFVRFKKSFFSLTLFSMAVANLTMWFENSFIETHDFEQYQSAMYKQYWTYIFNFFKPLAVMFRFNSALLFVVAYVDQLKI